MAVVSARGSPHSFPSSPLPPASPPQPGAERMFMRGGSGRSTGTSSSRSASLREIAEEAAVVDDDGGGKLYVAVSKDFKDGKSSLSAAQSLGILGGDLNLVLLHVHQPADRIMNVLHRLCAKITHTYMNLITSLHVFSVNCSAGLCKVPASQLEERELKAYRKIEQEEMNTLLNQYMLQAVSEVTLQVQAETLVIEKNNVANGFVELINQHSITKLAMGMSSFSTLFRFPTGSVDQCSTHETSFIGTSAACRTLTVNGAMGNRRPIITSSCFCLAPAVDQWRVP
ncbi:hypothetical protein C2845_PM04G10460 [Panicum miliaceum]|uniref:RING-type E3 ubiquitin transferase n=1 Tax=Panicum miliaceum TaxID=4540 RepID=A0A3L6QNY6_PANMI|nr:hypothetical protein C2845_PM04G10460 [Panicum miliaceum]